MPIVEMPVTFAEVQQSLDNATYTTEELIKRFLARIHAMNPSLQAYLSVSEDEAVKAAQAVDFLRVLHPKGLGRLAGIPFSVKDLIDTASTITTYGSRIFQDHRPTATATVVRRLESAHAILLGKAHLHEFAFGITNENSHFGPARNPADLMRITGGSSGGSAASVAAQCAIASIGTDTGGSVRIPAALTGVVGFKPSHGLLPLDGIWPLAPTLDHVGTLTHCVWDAAVLTEVMADFPAGQLTGPMSTPLSRPMRVAVPQALIAQFANDEVVLRFEQLLASLEAQAIIVYSGDVAIDADSIAKHQGNMMGAEASTVHENVFQRSPHLYGEDVRERLVSGLKITAQDYIRSLEFRRSFQTEVDEWFEFADVILLPTTPIVAPLIGTESVSIRGEDVHIRQLMTRFTNPWNLSGVPAISLPMGTLDGMPMGIQMVGKFGHDAQLLRLASCMQRNLIAMKSSL